MTTSNREMITQLILAALKPIVITTLSPETEEHDNTSLFERLRKNTAKRDLERAINALKKDFEDAIKEVEIHLL